MSAIGKFIPKSGAECRLYVWFGFASGMSLVDIGRVQQHFRQLFHRLPAADPIIAPVDIEID